MTRIYDLTIRVATTSENEYNVNININEIIEKIKQEIDSGIYGVEIQDIKVEEVKI